MAICISSMVACGKKDSVDTYSSDDTNSNSGSAKAAKEDVKSTEKKEGAQHVEITNDTGVTFSKLYISSADTDDWEEDLLDGQTLPDGKIANIHFEESEEAQYWDLKIVDSHGETYTWSDFDLLNISQITLSIDSDTGEPTAVYE